jgi:patatin-like phospholipase/acyl hydrolase
MSWWVQNRTSRAVWAESCTDGGGIRGISTLLILQKLMETIRDLCELDETPAPHLYFHLIGGTSTGG